jgi:glycosyltransferase involved in cell wall biosynthesis
VNDSSRPSPRVLYVVTSPTALALLRGQLAALGRSGYEPFIAASPGKELVEGAAAESAVPLPVPMAREIAPAADLRALFQLYRIMRRVRPSLTNVGTPKAGLLGGLAAWLAGVPCRVYTLRGLRWETTRGFRRRLLRAADWLACRVAHRVICVSGSLRERAVAERVVPREKAVLLAAGSSNGVDAARFAPSPDLACRARALRRGLRIPEDAPVIGFIGRSTRDKGVPELVAAHALLLPRWPRLRLLMAGRTESGDPLPEGTAERIRRTPQILALGQVRDVAAVLHLADVVALPSHREGFPNVLLEAAAAAKPVVAARVTGSVDAVVDGGTGLLVPAGDAAALAAALDRILGDPQLAANLGAAARRRVIAQFSQQRVWTALEAEYLSLLAAHRLPLPHAASRAAEPAGSRAEAVPG